MAICGRWTWWSTWALSPPGTSCQVSLTLTGAFVSCSRYNPECPLSQVQALEPWGNTVYGYAT